MPSIAIACIDTQNHSLARKAVEQTISCLFKCKAPANRVYWLSDQPVDCFSQVSLCWCPVAPISTFPYDYNLLCLRTLPDLIQEDFVLIVQHDGYAVNAQAWCDDFLNYDYIGAVSWSFLQPPVVGNGGFSLRSKKLMKALAKLNLPCDYDGEDAQICQYNRQQLEKDFGIKFAPHYLADRFSMESGRQSPWIGKSFGFHGKHDIAKYYTNYQFGE